jgi:glucan biosynthesis protein C
MTHTQLSLRKEHLSRSPACTPLLDRGRLLYIDNLRTMVIVMVILVHLSITYGGEGSWYYREGRADLLSGSVLSIHNAISQSFFMGLLFLLSAYFTAASYDRKGPGPFLRDRLLRLGIPLLVFEFLIHPFSVSLLFKTGLITGSLRDYLRSYYTSFHIGSGPLWLVEVLLIFSVLYVAWRQFYKRIPAAQKNSGHPPTLKGVLALGVLLGAVSFVARLWFPVNWALGPLNWQLAFFAQYIAMMFLGVTAYRRNWLERLPIAMALPCITLAGVLVVVVLPLLFVLGGAVSGKTGPYLGGWHWQAFGYAMWEQLLAIVMMINLLILFREHLNGQGKLARRAAASSYTVYIIHTPIVILFALVLRNSTLYPLLKFAAAALITIPFTFILANFLRQLPLARRIL